MNDNTYVEDGWVLGFVSWEQLINVAGERELHLLVKRPGSRRLEDKGQVFEPLDPWEFFDNDTASIYRDADEYMGSALAMIREAVESGEPEQAAAVARHYAKSYVKVAEMPAGHVAIANENDEIVETMPEAAVRIEYDGTIWQIGVADGR